MAQADPKSFSKQEQQQNAQTFPDSNPQQFENDTIDLYELWITLWKWKWLVIAVTVVAALWSIVYALQLKHTYKVETLLLKPKKKDIQLLNFLGIQIDNPQRPNSTRFSPTAVFDKFKQNLDSRTLHKKFIHETGLMELLAPVRTAETIDENIYKKFSNLIKLRQLDGFTSFSIVLHDPEIAAQWVNDFTEFINKETIAMLVEESENLIENQVRDIEYAISSKRQMAKKRRHDQIIRYDEAAKIANSLGIKRRVDATNIIQTTQMNVDIATASTPLYYLGFEALMSEIQILENRKSDDPFIGGLRDLQERLALLRSITFDKEKIRTVRVDQLAYPTKGTIKPSRRLVVSLATVAGLFSGIFLAFLIEFAIKSHRKRHSG